MVAAGTFTLTVAAPMIRRPVEGRHVPFVRTRWLAALMGGAIVALALGGLLLTGT